MLHPVLRHTLFVHRFVEAVTWQPLRQVLVARATSRPTLPREGQRSVPAQRAA